MHFKGSNKPDLSLIQIYLDASDKNYLGLILSWFGLKLSVYLKFLIVLVLLARKKILLFFLNPPQQSWVMISATVVFCCECEHCKHQLSLVWA